MMFLASIFAPRSGKQRTEGGEDQEEEFGSIRSSSGFNQQFVLGAPAPALPYFYLTLLYNTLLCFALLYLTLLYFALLYLTMLYRTQRERETETEIEIETETLTPTPDPDPDPDQRIPTRTRPARATNICLERRLPYEKKNDDRYDNKKNMKKMT